jgi:exopolysaccharide/PEP-CTERM locus tyrosine autokinase
MSSIIERALGAKGQSGVAKRQGMLRAALADEARHADGSRLVPDFTVNIAALQRAGYLTPTTLTGTLAEEFRLLKRPILQNAMGRSAAPVERGNVIAVTSALPHEGKTFTAMNLAMSIAQERDHTALLIDSDLIQRSLTAFLGIDDVPGLTDVLGDEDIHLAQVIGRTSIEKFRVVACGRVDHRGTELLASEQMSSLVSELSHRYPDRLVIFDAPPLLSTSQAVVLANLAGQILLVVEEGRTPQSSVQEALDLLDESAVIGLVLNKSMRRSGQGYYGSYYGVGSESSRGDADG